MQTAAPTLRQRGDKLDAAYQSFAHEWSDDGRPDWHNAYEYREEGYAIGEAASRIPDKESAREDFIEGEVEGCDEHAHHLIACAAYFRLAEIEAHRGDEREAA